MIALLKTETVKVQHQIPITTTLVSLVIKAYHTIISIFKNPLALTKFYRTQGKT